MDDWSFKPCDTASFQMGGHRDPSLEVIFLFSSILMPKDYCPAQICLIFHPMWSVDVCLIYAERFEIIPQLTCYGIVFCGTCPDPVTKRYIVCENLWVSARRCHPHFSGPDGIHAPLVPWYGVRTDSELTPRYSSVSNLCRPLFRQRTPLPYVTKQFLVKLY